MSKPQMKARTPRLDESSVIILATVVIALLAVIAVPKIRERPALPGSDPAQSARETYLSFARQIDTAKAARGIAAADSVQIAGREHLKRNLFAAEKPKRPVVTHKKTVTLPRLSAVYIDGGRVQAVLGDQLVSLGDRIKGFTVIEIHPQWVLLRKGDTEKRLQLGGK